MSDTNDTTFTPPNPGEPQFALTDDEQLEAACAIEEFATTWLETNASEYTKADLLAILGGIIEANLTDDDDDDTETETITSFTGDDGRVYFTETDGSFDNAGIPEWRHP
jgi:hypothetical protein